MRNLDVIDFVALALVFVGGALLVYGLALNPPSSFEGFVRNEFGDWAPGLIIDGILLLTINRVIHSQERKRVISQVASLSNEFALDAVRRCRNEGWLQNGTMTGMSFEGANLGSADLSDSNLSETDFSFAKLSGVDLTHANLKGINLKGANLQGADLRWADLSRASLQWADLRNANLTGSRLDGAKADFALVDKAHLSIQELENSVVDGYISERQIELVTSTFHEFSLLGNSGGIRFYERFFETTPHLSKLFDNDIERQAKMFLQALSVIVNSLSSTERAARVLKRLGDIHHSYGVEPDHYTLLGTALIETIRESLGDNFSDEANEAWTAAFRLISSVMISASEVP